MRALLLLFFFASCQLTYAQDATNSKALWVGGALGYSSSSSKNASSSIITLSPDLKYFLKKGLFVGGNVDWRRQKDGGSIISTLGIGPLAGITFEDDEAISIPYVAAGLGYLSNRLDDGVAILSRTGVEFSVNAGMNIRLKPSLGVTVEAGYSMQFYNNGVNFNVLSVNLGIIGIL